MNDISKYKDIINLPHHISKKHPQMSLEMRSAQFAPFSPLTGYESAVKETGRLTDKRIEINEEQEELLSQKLQEIKEKITQKPQITVTYFIPDTKKAGGEYKTITGNVRKIDEYKNTIILENKLEIPISEITEILDKWNFCTTYLWQYSLILEKYHVIMITTRKT